jgi:hypothetical protein
MTSRSLRSTLESLALTFADSVLDALRSAPIDELMGGSAAPAARPARPTRPARRAAARVARRPRAVAAPAPVVRGGRLARRSSEDLERTLGLVVAAVQSNGMRAEDIQKFLSLDRRELPRVLALGLSKKVLRKTGAKRATKYHAV